MRQLSPARKATFTICVFLIVGVLVLSLVPANERADPVPDPGPSLSDQDRAQAAAAEYRENHPDLASAIDRSDCGRLADISEEMYAGFERLTQEEKTGASGRTALGGITLVMERSEALGCR